MPQITDVELMLAAGGLAILLGASAYLVVRLRTGRPGPWRAASAFPCAHDWIVSLLFAGAAMLLLVGIREAVGRLPY